MTSELIVSYSGIRGIFGVTLTADVVARYGAAFGRMIVARHRMRTPTPTILLGRDTRTSGPALFAGAVRGLSQFGTLVDLGVVATPTLQHALGAFDAEAALCITASHNPAQWNGLKLFLAPERVVLDGPHMKELRALAEERDASDPSGVVPALANGRHDEAVRIHVERVCAHLDVERIHAAKFRVAVDSGGGAGEEVTLLLLDALGCTAVLPDLFGEAGRNPELGSKLSQGGYVMKTFTSICISREFTAFALGQASPIINWLRALAHQEHERCGGPGVGAVGMCFTGGFALAMAVDPLVIAPVLSQPSNPIGITKSRKRSIDASNADIEVVRGRCVNEGLKVLGLRFEGDPFVPKERFDFLHERLGDGFISVELTQADGHPDSPMAKHHSVLTGDLIDEPGEPTRVALDQVLELFRSKLLV